MLALLLLACASEPPPMSEEELSKTIDATPDAEQRLTLLEVHVTRNPDSANGHLWLARAYRERGDARAKETFEKAAALDPKDPISRIELAYYLIEPSLRRGVDPAKEDLDTALKLGQEAMAAAPTCETRHHVVGLYELRIEAGVVDPDVYTFLSEGLEACKTDPMAIAWEATMGRAYRKEGKKAEAEQWLCKAAVDGNVKAASECLDAVKENGGAPCQTPEKLGQAGEAWTKALGAWDCTK